MTRDVLCVRPDLDVSTVVRLMIDRHVGCLPVVDERRRPVGVITKFDLVEQIDAAMRLTVTGGSMPSDLLPQVAEHVMMPLALTLDENATVAHAAVMMDLEDTHHVLVVDHSGVLLGVVSSKDIVHWVAQREQLSAPDHWPPDVVAPAASLDRAP